MAGSLGIADPVVKLAQDLVQDPEVLRGHFEDREIHVVVQPGEIQRVRHVQDGMADDLHIGNFRDHGVAGPDTVEYIRIRPAQARDHSDAGGRHKRSGDAGRQAAPAILRQRGAAGDREHVGAQHRILGGVLLEVVF